MNLFEILNRFSQERNLPFLLIGGLAVNLYGYSRDTHDVDLLVQKVQRLEWQRFLFSLGYSLFREEENFSQFAAEKPPASWPLDLMHVNEQTLAKMVAASQSFVHGGVSVRVPSVDHLIALKLHVLKQNMPHRAIKDFLDIQALVEHQKVDLRSTTMQEIFSKYGTENLYRRLLVSCDQ